MRIQSISSMMNTQKSINFKGQKYNNYGFNPNSLVQDTFVSKAKQNEFNISFAGIKMHKSKKIKTPSEVKATNKEVQQIKQIGDKVQLKGQEKYKEIEILAQELTELHNLGTTVNKSSQRIVTDAKMDEYENGKLVRRSTFDAKSGEIQSITEVNGTETNEYVFYNGKPRSYQEGVVNFENGNAKSDKAFVFRDGELTRFTKDYISYANGNFEYQKEYRFLNGQLLSFVDNFESKAYDTITYNREATFKLGKPEKFVKGYEGKSNGRKKCVKSLEYENGQPTHYRENYEETNIGLGGSRKEKVLQFGEWV